MTTPQRVKSSPFAPEMDVQSHEPAPVAVGRVPMTPEAQEQQMALEAQAKKQAALEAQATETERHGTAAPYERIPMGTRRAKLARPKRPGFVRRWFSDVNGRIQEAQAAGYAFVLDAKGAPDKYRVDTDQHGNAVWGFLMEIPEAFYDQDFAAKQNSLNETDMAIYTGKHNELPDDNRYIPKSTPMRVTHGTRL